MFGTLQYSCALPLSRAQRGSGEFGDTANFRRTSARPAEHGLLRLYIVGTLVRPGLQLTTGHG